MLYKLVGQSETDDVRMVAVIAHPLKDGRAQSTVAYAVFDGDDVLEAAAHLVENLFVERFQEAHVVDGSLYLVVHGTFDSGLQGIVADGAQGKDGHIAALTEFAPGAYGNLLQRTTPVDQRATATGIADDEGPLAVELSGVHHPSQLVLVEW